MVWGIGALNVSDTPMFPQGGKEYLMRAHFGLPSVEKEEVEGRPPIGVKFEIPYFTVSGIQVREGGRVVPLLDLGGSPFLSFLGLDRLRSLAWLISSFTVILFFFFWNSVAFSLNKHFNFNFWVCWVFVVVSELSLVAVSRGYFFNCGGFSCCRAWVLEPEGFSSCRAQA